MNSRAHNRMSVETDTGGTDYFAGHPPSLGKAFVVSPGFQPRVTHSPATWWCIPPNTPRRARRVRSPATTKSGYRLLTTGYLNGRKHDRATTADDPGQRPPPGSLDPPCPA